MRSPRWYPSGFHRLVHRNHGEGWGSRRNLPQFARKSCQIFGKRWNRAGTNTWRGTCRIWETRAKTACTSISTLLIKPRVSASDHTNRGVLLSTGIVLMRYGSYRLWYRSSKFNLWSLATSGGDFHFRATKLDQNMRNPSSQFNQTLPNLIIS